MGAVVMGFNKNKRAVIYKSDISKSPYYYLKVLIVESFDIFEL